MVGILKAMAARPHAFNPGDAALLSLLSEIVAASMHFATVYSQDDLFVRATHDALTGLANRALFMDRLRRTLAASLRGDDGCATARAVALRNGARVDLCRADVAVVTLRAESSTPSVVWGTRFRAQAEARAAPDFYVPDASRRSRSSSRTAPALSSGSLPLPHFGD